MAEPVLDVRGLTKAYGALKVSDGIDLDVRPGEVHAVIGPNGAGKTSLIDQICGTRPPDAGSIRLFGREASRLAAHRRARMGLARTFQITDVLAGFTVLENVAVAAQRLDGTSFRFVRPVSREAALNEKARAILETVGLEARMHAPARALSHGEKRQLELAMALALEPRLLVLDEPMAGTGAREGAKLVGLLQRLAARTAMLLVEHDMDAVFALAGRVSVLVYGRVIATGTPEAIRADPAVRAAYLGEDAT